MHWTPGSMECLSRFVCTVQALTFINLWNECRAIYHFLTFMMIIISIIFCTHSALAFAVHVNVCNQSNEHVLPSSPHQKWRRRDIAKSILIYALHPFPDGCPSLLAFCNSVGATAARFVPIFFNSEWNRFTISVAFTHTTIWYHFNSYLRRVTICRALLAASLCVYHHGQCIALILLAWHRTPLSTSSRFEQCNGEHTKNTAIWMHANYW